MISPSKLALALSALLGGLGVALVGCGPSDTSLSPSNTKVDVQAAARQQQGQGGVKAAHGGGVFEGPTPAGPGESTEVLQGGRK